VSPRAAARLETLGFTRVYDYVAGKKGWGSFGLPHEGTTLPTRTAGDAAHRDVPTCRLDEALQEVRKRVRDAGWNTCIVLGDDGVVLGRIGRKALAADDGRTAEESMTPGPSTVRPSIGTDALLERMRMREVRSYVVTTPDGRLVGLVRADDLAEAAG
jgi:CBS domain-containing protein